MLASQILRSTDCEIASPLRQAETRTVYWAGAKLVLLGPRSDCVCERANEVMYRKSSVLAARIESNNNQSVSDDAERERAKFSAARKTFLHSQQDQGADRTLFFFCILVLSLRHPVSFALRSSRRESSEHEPILRGRWGWKFRPLQSCWHFLRRIKGARVFFCPSDGPVSSGQVQSGREICLSGKWLD